MSTAVDANVLIYASDRASVVHHRARELVARIATGPDIVYLFWPTVVAYLRVVTHAHIFSAPLSVADATANIEAILSRAHVRSPGEGPDFWGTLREAALEVHARGNLGSDAHIVALMRQHGVRTIWTRDRDFRKFDGIEAVDPFS